MRIAQKGQQWTKIEKWKKTPTYRRRWRKISPLQDALWRCIVTMTFFSLSPYSIVSFPCFLFLLRVLHPMVKRNLQCKVLAKNMLKDENKWGRHNKNWMDRDLHDVVLAHRGETRWSWWIMVLHGALNGRLCFRTHEG